MNPHHTCPHCKGRGIVELNGVYADTLALLRTMTEPASGAALARLARCPATAMNNRLARLEEHGYARSHRYGRERRFEAIR